MTRSAPLSCILGTAALAMASVATAPARADGFRNPPPTAAGVARAGALQAQADDASAISYNPANLAWLTEPEVMASLTLARTQMDYTAFTGPRASMEDTWQALPNLYGIWTMDEMEVVGGIALTTPYGQSSEWPKRGPFAYMAPHFAEMRLANFNPTAAFRLSETIALGLGVDVYMSTLELKQEYPWSQVGGYPGAADGEAHFEAGGAGIGGNLGLTWQPVEAHRLALTYRSPVRVDYEGEVELSNVPPPAQGLTLNGDFSTDITFPDIAGAAWGIRLTEQLSVEADVEWLGWSRYDELTLDVDADSPLVPSQELRQDWEDTWTYGVSAEWEVDESWRLRAGYAVIESPVPDETFSPVLPDADRQVFAAGIGYRVGRHALDAAFTYSVYDDRRVTNNRNPSFNGKYEIDSELFSITYRVAL